MKATEKTFFRMQRSINVIMTFDLNTIKFIQLTVHLKVHYEKHDFDLTQTNITNAITDSKNFSENVHVWQAVLQKPYKHVKLKKLL